MWQLASVKGSCTTVNLIEASRAGRNYPAYLSTSSSCDDASVFMASKDYGTGRQQFTLVKHL